MPSTYSKGNTVRSSLVAETASNVGDILTSKFTTAVSWYHARIYTKGEEMMYRSFKSSVAMWDMCGKTDNLQAEERTQERLSGELSRLMAGPSLMGIH